MKLSRLHMAVPVLAVGLALPTLAQDAPPPPPPPWTGSLGLGLSVTTGNSDTLGFNVTLDTKYAPDAVNLFKAGALYLYQRSDGERTVDKSWAALRYERTFSPKLFAFGEVSYTRDPFKNVTYLISPLVGVGYNAIKTPKLTLTFDGSVGGVFEKNEGAGTRSAGAYSIGESFSAKLSPTATFSQRLAGLFKMNDSSDYNVHADASLATAITKKSELKATYAVDYKNQPVGIGVKKTDSTFILAWVVKL